MVLTPLNVKDQKLFEDALKEIEKKIQKPKAKEFFESKGFKVQDMLDTIKKAKAFDGTRSNMPVTLCGIIKGSCDIPVSEYILKRYPGVKVCVGINREETRHNIYFFGRHALKPIHILHELFHCMTGLTDNELADKLGFKIPKGRTIEISYQLEKCL